MKMCISCGMPLEKPEDYPLQDTGKDYCVYCANPDGSLKSYEKALEDATAYYAKEHGLDAAEAKKAMQKYLDTMPAWKDRAN